MMDELILLFQARPRIIIFIIWTTYFQSNDNHVIMYSVLHFFFISSNFTKLSGTHLTFQRLLKILFIRVNMQDTQGMQISKIQNHFFLS